MKLIDDKIRWIIRRKVEGSLTTAQIAELQGVDQSRIRQLWLEFRNTGKVPTLKEPAGQDRSDLWFRIIFAVASHSLLDWV